MILMLSSHSINCAYSYTDLYVAATDRPPSPKTQAYYDRLTQVQRNSAVKRLAQRAGWLTEDRLWQDGVTYTAFWPAGA